MVEEILQAIASFTLSAAIIAYLAKELVKLWISKDLEAHKARLQSESAREAERLRAELTRSNLEHEVRFTRLHEQRARVIAGIFGRLERLHQSFAILNWQLEFAGPEHIHQLGEGAITAFRDFSEYYQPRALWLDTETSNALNSIIRHLQEAAIPLLLASTDIRTVTQSELKNAATILGRDIPPARKRLLDQFRDILGVEPKNSAMQIAKESQT